MISGKTTLIAHLGYPTHSFKAPLIYNPWFEKNNIDAVVVPMGVKAEEYPEFLKYLFRLTNIRGALVTMPHKVTTMDLVDEATPTAQVAGATNAVLLRDDGSLLADQFDGAGFVRGVQRKGFDLDRQTGSRGGRRRGRLRDRGVAGGRRSRRPRGLRPERRGGGRDSPRGSTSTTRRSRSTRGRRTPQGTTSSSTPHRWA